MYNSHALHISLQKIPWSSREAQSSVHQKQAAISRGRKVHTDIKRQVCQELYLNSKLSLGNISWRTKSALPYIKIIIPHATSC